MAQLNLPLRQVAPPKWPSGRERAGSLPRGFATHWNCRPSLDAHKTLKLATKGRGFKGAELRAAAAAAAASKTSGLKGERNHGKQGQIWAGIIRKPWVPLSPWLAGVNLSRPASR